MPPKSTKRGKKPSPRAAKKAKAAATSSPLPIVAEENIDPVAVEEDAMAAGAEVSPMASIEGKKMPKMEVDDETSVEKTLEEGGVDKQIEEEAVLEKEILPKLEVEGGLATEETLGEETIREKDVGETTEEKIEEVTVVESALEEEEAHVEKVVETLETPAVMEEEFAMEVEVEEEEEPEEEKVEEEEDPEEQGDRPIGEEEKGEGEVENISDVNNDIGNLNENNACNGDGDDEENDDDVPSLYMQTSLTESKKEKKFEIFVGGLEKGAVEDDLIKVFGEFGEIESLRIVKHPITQKSKGFAFIRYTSIEHSKKALAELKDGTEVKGKRIRVSASQDNDTLYLGNICKTWTRDQVVETLKGYGVEQIEDILLPDDPRSEGKIKGFAFLEFKSHSDAMAAFHRLRQPDAVFGRDVSAKVAFAQTPLHPTEEDLLQVKTVYIESIPKTWDEHKVEKLCKQYGEIEKIQLSRNFTKTKRKDFGFVEFTSRDSAVACVEGINNAELGEDVIVKVNLAKPINKSRLAKQIARGGYKLEKNEKATEEGGNSMKEKGKSKVVREKEMTQSNSEKPNTNLPSKSQDIGVSVGKGSQTTQSAKGKKRGRQGIDIDTTTNKQPFKKTRSYPMGTTTNQQPSKKAQNNRMETTKNQQPSKRARNNRSGKGRGRPSTAYTNPRSPYPSVAYVPHHTTYATRYAAPATSYAATDYAGTSGSQHRRHDLEPHAGYITAAEQVRNPYDYNMGRMGAYDSQSRNISGYAGASRIQSTYPGYPSYAVYEPGYAYPGSGYSNAGAYTYRGAYY